MKIGKEAFYRQLEMGLDEAYRYTAEVMVENLMARDAQEGISAFVEKRPPKWEDQVTAAPAPFKHSRPARSPRSAGADAAW